MNCFAEGYVDPVLKTDGHAQPCLSMPMDNRFQPQMPREPVSPAVPFNTWVPRAPMDDPFLSHMPLVPAYPSVAFDRFMHAWLREHTSVRLNEHEPLPPPATVANTIVNRN